MVLLFTLLNKCFLFTDLFATVIIVSSPVVRSGFSHATPIERLNVKHHPHHLSLTSAIRGNLCTAMLAVWHSLIYFSKIWRTVEYHRGDHVDSLIIHNLPWFKHSMSYIRVLLKCLIRFMQKIAKKANFDFK